MQLLIKQQTGEKMITKTFRICAVLCTARTIANLMHDNSPGGSTLSR